MRITALLAAMCMTAPACAQDLFGGPAEKQKEWPDGPNKRFFQNLQRPDNYLREGPNYDVNEPVSCCGAGDVVKTKFKVEPGDGPHPADTWYAWLDGKWVRIPPEKIVPDYAPDGQAFLFMLTLHRHDGPPIMSPSKVTREIVCFVRPNSGN